MTNPNEPAFPRAHTEINGKYVLGVTKRELFTALAMLGIVVGWRGTDSFLSVNDEGLTLPQLALSLADAVIAELNKEKS